MARRRNGWGYACCGPNMWFGWVSDRSYIDPVYLNVSIWWHSDQYQLPLGRCQAPRGWWVGGGLGRCRAGVAGRGRRWGGVSGFPIAPIYNTVSQQIFISPWVLGISYTTSSEFNVMKPIGRVSVSNWEGVSNHDSRIKSQFLVLNLQGGFTISLNLIFS